MVTSGPTILWIPAAASKRAGVGAGGLSPNSSFAGSFIFCGGDGVLARAIAAPRPTGAVLVLRL